jgi:hypothetical protein
MSKIARPAFAEAVEFTKREWRGIMLLALKTYLLLMLFQILASLPAHMMMKPEDAMYINTRPISFSDLPMSLIAMNMVSGVIGFFLTQWIVAPLYIAIARSVVLGEPFDRILCARLTEPRTVRVTKLMWSMAIFVIPFYALLFGLMLMIIPMTQVGAVVQPALIAFAIFVAVAYLIFFTYVALRIYYLIPAFACDRKFSSLSEIWDHSRGQAWSVLKVILLGMVFYICLLIVFVAGFVLLAALLSAISHMVITGKLAIQILLGFAIFALFIFMLAILALLIPQMISASVASVYRISQGKA